MISKTTDIETLHSAAEIHARIEQLGRDIRQDAGDREICLVGILKGALVFLADLLRCIPGPVHYEFIDVIRDISDTEVAEAMEIDFLTHFSIEGKYVYLLKDVVSTGVIETWLTNQLRQRNPASIRMVALLDRPEQRTVDFDVDFAAFRARDGVYAGFGLEYEGHEGNLPFIGRII
ncbi:MAG: phosphoribosyltransferase family protein [Thermoanaerobaculia bacterium]